MSDIAHLQLSISWHLFLWSTASDWNCTFCEGQSHHIFPNRMWVILHILWKAVSSPLFLMTNSLWVILHILGKAASSHLFLWPAASKWHCTFCDRQSHDVFFYDQLSKWVTIDILRKAVSWHLSLIWIGCEWHCHIGHFASHLFLWPTGSGWHCTFCEGSLITSSPMTNSLWVMLPICERQFHHIFSYV